MSHSPFHAFLRFSNSLPFLCLTGAHTCPVHSLDQDSSTSRRTHAHTSGKRSQKPSYGHLQILPGLPSQALSSPFQCFLHQLKKTPRFPYSSEMVTVWQESEAFKQCLSLNTTVELTIRVCRNSSGLSTRRILMMT